MSAGVLRGAATALLDLLLPRACAICGRLQEAGDERVACGQCWSRVRRLPHPQCDRCGHPVRPGACRMCDNFPPFVRALRSVAWMSGDTGGAIVHALKYDGWHRVAGEMAREMARTTWPADVLAERSCLIPVPLSTTRERERGYNQSAHLAAALSREWTLPVHADVLVRERSRSSQTRLTPDRRRINVAGAFHARDPDRCLSGSHVILVDDVVTTGATLAAAAAALLDAGTRIVSAVTFGRAPASGDPV